MDWREKKRKGKSGSSETSEEPVVIIEHNYFEGEDGGNNICHIAKRSPLPPLLQRRTPGSHYFHNFESTLPNVSGGEETFL